MSLSSLMTNDYLLIVTFRSFNLTSQVRTIVHRSMYCRTSHVLGRQLEPFLVINKVLAT